jgi:hypothetical protein
MESITTIIATTSESFLALVRHHMPERHGTWQAATFPDHNLHIYTQVTNLEQLRSTPPRFGHHMSVARIVAEYGRNAGFSLSWFALDSTRLEVQCESRDPELNPVFAHLVDLLDSRWPESGLHRQVPANMHRKPKNRLSKERERKIKVTLRMKLDGEPHKVIARELEVTERTISDYVATLIKRGQLPPDA